MSFQMPRKIRVSETFCRVREKKDGYKYGLFITN
jgi:hypothetical protein